VIDYLVHSDEILTDIMSDDRDKTATLYSRPISQAEYLKLEETAKERHEYVAGRAYAMTGASFAHNVLVANL
jgi:hypothetical protein